LDRTILTDHFAHYCSFDTRRLENGSVCIPCEEKENGLTYAVSSAKFDYRSFEILDVKFINKTTQRYDPAFFRDLVPPNLTREKCQRIACDLRVYLVTYRIFADGKSAMRRRIVIVPTFDVSDRFETLDAVIGWLNWFFYFSLFVGGLSGILLLLILHQRIYACFMYFICGSNDRIYAEKAWDTLYFFRYPLDSQARSQKIYEILYLKED